MVKTQDMGWRSYSVAIRTLGLAGDKFKKELASIFRQTILPDGVYAYIPFGYDIPDFDGSEKITWIRCDKGMVTQRSLPMDEITSDYILFLDDDVELAPNSVERMFDAIFSHSADVVVADMFANHQVGHIKKCVTLLDGTGFFLSKKWGLKVRSSAYFSYNIAPLSDVMQTQSGAGACSLVSRLAYKSIHFEDERWMESFGYCLGEDQLFFNKMHSMGWKVMIHYKSGVKNLDAATGGRNNMRRNVRNSPILRYVIWHRTQYLVARSVWQKFFAVLSYSLMQLPISVGDLLFCIRDRNFYRLYCRMRGIMDGIKFTSSKTYKSIPLFNAYRRVQEICINEDR